MSYLVMHVVRSCVGQLICDLVGFELYLDVN